MSVKRPSRPQVRSKNAPAKQSPRFAELARPLLYALGIAVLTIGLYEIVERTWLVGADMEVLHALHRVRDITTSLVVAAVFGWRIIRISPGFLPVSLPEDEEWSNGTRRTELERTKIYAQWFIAMRWIAVVVAALLVFISVKVLRWLPAEVWWPLACTVAVLGASNILYNFLIRWDRGAPAMLLFQGYVDLAILTVLLHFSGGLENPLSAIMLFHVIIGGILLSRGQCYGIAAVGTLLFALMAWGEWSDVVEHYTLQLYPHFHEAGHTFHPAHHSLFAISLSVLQTAILFLTAYFVTTLSERMRYNERRLEAMADRATADRQLLERALETTDTGLRVLDRDLQPYWASKRWDEWFVARKEATCPACDVLNQNDSPARQCLQDGQVQVTELELDPAACPSKMSESRCGQRTFQITTAPLVDLSGQMSKVVELAQDITQQKQTQAQMMRAGKLAAVGELAGQVAHEVNNPIAILGAKARLLLSDHRHEMSPKIAQELGKITDLADRVARIAQGLLSYCRPSGATRVALNLCVPVRKSLAMVEQRAKTAGVRIEDLLPDRMANVKANANEMEQIFLNLFLNSLDAMPKGGWLKVTALQDSVQLSDRKPALAVVVEDTGDGIADSVRDRIFEPFFTTKQEGQGTGLGLSICLGLVRSHGGEIEVETKVWQGTRVTVKLPLHAPTGKDVNDNG
ncbi:MAG: hypothetical protein HY735_08390 [Verrucomicrobia bacterium]|nr:hypothetical protein [Verrucomicrobiota bacterium]